MAGELVTVWRGDSGWLDRPSHGGGLTTYAGGSAAQQMVAEAPVHGRYEGSGFDRERGKTSTRDQILKARRQKDRERIAAMHENGVGIAVIATLMQMRRCTVSRIVKNL